MLDTGTVALMAGLGLWNTGQRRQTSTSQPQTQTHISFKCVQISIDNLHASQVSAYCDHYSTACFADHCKTFRKMDKNENTDLADKGDNDCDDSNPKG